MDSLESFFLLPSISLPTRITDRSRTLIDNIFFTFSKYKPHSGNLLSGISDHLPQFLILENFSSNFRKEPKFYRKWKNFDTNKFKEDFHRTDWNDILQPDSENPDLLFESFFDRTNTLIDIHAPLKKLTNKQIKKCAKPWTTKGLKTSIAKRDNLLKAYCKEKDNTVKNITHQVQIL